MKMKERKHSISGEKTPTRACPGRLIRQLFFLLLVLNVSACEKELEVWETKHPDNSSDSTTYDAPFNNIPSTSDIIMYEVNLSAFSTQGNLEGVRAGLDALKDLGVNVIWLMPLHPIGGLNGIGSPYSVKDYFGVNADFGTMDELKLLVKEAHEKDMAVILDWVANHTSWDNSWITNKSWYVQDASGNIVSPNGWNDVAELNFSSQEMKKEMIKAMKYWVQEANVDGYRCDVADGVPSNFWKEAIDTLRALPDRKIIMFAEGTRKDLFTAGFNLTFGWNYYHTLKDVYNNNEAVSGLVNANNEDYINIPIGSHILRFTSNHDDNAWDDTPEHIFLSKEGSMGAFVLTAYMGGVPLIYSGQEVGYPNRLSFFSDNTTKIDWSINPGMRLEYTKLIEFRRYSEAVRKGSLTAYTSNSDVIAFQRTSGTQQVLVIVNVRNSAISYELPESIANTTWTDVMTTSEFNLVDILEMAPTSYYILKN